jgi:DNA polymerase-3 subunit delta
VVLWALARELRTLAGMAAEVAGGSALPAVLAKYRVWANRKNLVGQALRRLPAARCRSLLRQCARLDRVCKGQAAGNPWDELLQLTMQLAGKPVLADPEQTF